MIRAIDDNGNIYGSALVGGMEQLKQDIECQLKLFKGENPYNLDEGIAWYDEIEYYSEARMKAVIRERILTVNNVSGLEEDVVITLVSGTLNVSCFVTTSLSPIPQQIEIEI